MNCSYCNGEKNPSPAAQTQNCLIFPLVGTPRVHIMKKNPSRLTLPDSHTPMSAPLENKYYVNQTDIISAVKKAIS